MIPNVFIASAGQQGAFPAQTQKRKRLPRAAIACNVCRARKSRCNQDKPTCSHCLHYGFECTYPAKKQERRNTTLQEPSPRGVLAPVSTVSNTSTASSTACAVEHVPGFPTLFDGGTLSRVETQQSLVFAQTVSNERRSAVEDFGVETSRISDLLPQYGRSHDQESEGETQPNCSDFSQQSINPIPVGSQTTVHGPAGLAGSDSVDEINNHTTGAEFFGPSGTLPFLARLLACSRVSAQHDTIPATDGRPPSNHNSLDTGQLSLVSFLHSEDYPVPTRQHTPEQCLTSELYFPPGRVRNGGSRSAGVDVSSTGARFESPVVYADQSSTQSRSQNYQPTLQNKGDMLMQPPNNHPIISDPDLSIRLAEGFDTWSSQVEIEKRCVNLFFTNLHYIHPILLKSSFIARCVREVWSDARKQELRNRHPAYRSRFLALYNAVCAVGAITADEGTIFGNVTTVPSGELPSTTPDGSSKKKPKAIYPPLKLARVFFEQAKLNLGDVFEICSLESTQTLFLMSVFCQNALKPHSCYMYIGMAARTALAIGITNVKAEDSLVDRAAASNLWWCIYAHEIEMCCASGRDTLLKPPEYYSVLLAPIDEKHDFDKYIVGAMVSFAKILQVASEELYHPLREKSLLQMSETAIELDDALQKWKSDLPPILNIDKASLRDPEWLGKQKVVLKLRFCNARIILHRQFLVASGTHDLETFSRHIHLCLDASRQTIRLLYETYLNRHYFRTWWYNTTYVLYASMIILYLILLDFNKGDPDVLVGDVEKSLEILGSMDEVHVAHGCAQLISEVLVIAKKQISSRKEQVVVIPTFCNPSVNANSTQEPLEGSITMTTEALEGAFDGEILSNLVDFNLLANIAGFSGLDYFFGGGGKIPADGTVMRPGGYDSNGYPLMNAEDYLQLGEDGVLL